MKLAEVTIGGEYRVKIGNRLAPVRVIAQRERRRWGNSPRQTVFECRTLDTGRTIIASPARLRPAPAPARDPVAVAAAACGWDAAWLRDHMEAWIGRAAATPLDRCGLRRAIVAALTDCPTRPLHAGWPEMADDGDRMLEASARFVPA